MAKIQFKSYPQGQTVLFPSDLGENIPENDPVRIVSRIVDGLNMQMKFNKQYKRFRHKGKDKVNMDFGLFAIAFNIQKYIRMTA